MPVPSANSDLLDLLRDKATRLRIHSIRSTTAAGSGHPTSCASAAEIMSTLFYSVMRYDPGSPASSRNDEFILSKGHAAPILYAAWAEAGALPVSELLELRKINSDLEGHPTPRLPFVRVATGSLGQGLSAGIGMALNAKYLESSDQRIYVLLGDGECAEGSVWEAAAVAARYRLGNLCATVDVNRLGQSEATMLEHEMRAYQARWKAFGWNALVVDGHNLEELLAAYAKAMKTRSKPTVVLARTLKGKGIPSAEDQNGRHGKPLEAHEAEEVMGLLERQLSAEPPNWTPNLPKPAKARRKGAEAQATQTPIEPPYTVGDKPVATRQAFGVALAAIGKADPRIVVMDGDVKNSTHTEDFQKESGDRFFQMYIAEQNMVGAAMGLAAKGKIPFASSFACFLSRAYDFVRMAAISSSNIKLAGSHAGISIGEDGPSQMGLEDLAMFCAEPNFTVLYPSDAVSAWRATELAVEVQGPVYIRTTRPKTPVIYRANDDFKIGKCKVLRQTDDDRVTIVAAGVTLFEALKAYEHLTKEGIPVRVIDLFSVQPVDRTGLIESARQTGGKILVVEDHYIHGGIGDAVAGALADEEGIVVSKMAVREIPRSGSAPELMDAFGISANHIVEKVAQLLRTEQESSKHA